MTLVREVSIENYKSIRKLTLELGRVNVLIGANGSGKSNVLEAIALGATSARVELDDEYTVPRGIRVTEPRFMRSAFPGSDVTGPIVVRFAEGSIALAIDPERRTLTLLDEFVRAVVGVELESIEQRLSKIEGGEEPNPRKALKVLRLELEGLPSLMSTRAKAHIPPELLIYAPESSALRAFQAEPRIEPLGIKGEGLFAHLRSLGTPEHAGRLAAIGDRLALLDWFERIEIPKDLAPGERSLRVRDRYLAEGALFDQRSAGEGFLFLLFYLTLFISPATPAFFAIDNVDASLSPKLVATMVEQLVALAKEHDKQVIFTTRNPAVLDGLDLADDEQRLFVTERGNDGATQARRVSAPKPPDGDEPVPLSEAFMRGFLGGLPKNF